MKTNSWQLHPNSFMARAVLGLIPTSAILYAWVTPLIVSALEQSPSTSAQAAGYVFSANLYGTALGGLLAIRLVKRFPWRPVCLTLLSVVVLADIVSIWVTTPTWLAALRFLHGIAGGLAMGFAALVIARTQQPERTISVTFILQTLLGGAILFGVSPLMATYGVLPVWICLIVVSIVCLCALPFLDEYPDPIVGGAANHRQPALTAPKMITALAIVVLFVYQGTQQGAWAYIFELGQNFGLSDAFLGSASGIAIWTGGLAAVFTAFWSMRSGYRLPVMASGILSACAVALMSNYTAAAYVAGAIGWTFFYTITMVYLLAMFAALDASGRFATVGNFVSTFGLATGPLLSASLLGEGVSYSSLMWLAAVGMAAASLVALVPARHLESIQQS